MSDIRYIPRYPVEARKDPAVAPAPWDVDRADWPGAAEVLSGAEARILCAVLLCLCPHDWLGDGPYRLATLRIDAAASASAGDALLVRELIGAVEEAAGGKFGDLDFDARTDILRGLEETPGFRRVLALTIRHLYDDPVVWAGCGYEGVVGCHPDAVRDNNNDLDWLPDAESLIRGAI
ncbi:MAG: hypothetical protein DI556_21480 [Rhodovulum sulfidophilum]|uniref:Gluconate 2-dehydrogenase subunit 3 family protein n=1 Tax=Rhodovulum sulfidophilum TaxID=35806 RepID=A0A2W5MXP3_RHOSU|nr:MAG: hypothetical protein DI556_21480 [Rhodovulum sulfidophilum]